MTSKVFLYDWQRYYEVLINKPVSKILQNDPKPISAEKDRFVVNVQSNVGFHCTSSVKYCGDSHSVKTEIAICLSVHICVEYCPLDSTTAHLPRCD